MIDNFILIRRVNELSNTFEQTMSIISTVIGIIFFTLFFYQNIHLIVAIFCRPKKYPKTEKLNKFAIVICAHDEEKVVGNLIDSIFLSDYPKELMKVFVVADNCKDGTAEVARKAGAIVYERFSETEKGKCYALDHIFHIINADYVDENFDAVFLFDADNLLDPQYMRKMNDMLNAGVRVGTGYRGSKNYRDSAISIACSIMLARECRLVEFAQTKLGVNTCVLGTGFYISMDIVKAMGGWPYRTLTEDTEFSADCIDRRIKIGYNDEAVFYDEQPNHLKGAWFQARRWTYGGLQVWKKYYLHKNPARKKKFWSQSRYEMFMRCSPVPAISLAVFILFILINVAFGIPTGQIDGTFLFQEVVLPIIFRLSYVVLLAYLQAAIVSVKKRKLYHRNAAQMLLDSWIFVPYALLISVAQIVSIFRPAVWKKIEHNRSIQIETINAENADEKK